MLQGKSLWHNTALTDRSDMGGEAKAEFRVTVTRGKLTLERKSHSISHRRERIADCLFPRPNETLVSSGSAGRAGHPARLGLPQSHSGSREKNQAHAVAVVNEGGNSAAKDNRVNGTINSNTTGLFFVLSAGLSPRLLSGNGSGPATTPGNRLCTGLAGAQQ